MTDEPRNRPLLPEEMAEAVRKNTEELVERQEALADHIELVNTIDSIGSDTRISGMDGSFLLGLTLAAISAFSKDEGLKKENVGIANDLITRGIGRMVQERLTEPDRERTAFVEKRSESGRFYPHPRFARANGLPGAQSAHQHGAGKGSNQPKNREDSMNSQHLDSLQSLLDALLMQPGMTSIVRGIVRDGTMSAEEIVGCLEALAKATGYDPLLELGDLVEGE